MPHMIARSKGKVHKIGVEKTMTIGRAKQCDFCFEDPCVSRQHCRIEQLDDGRWALVDLKSFHGTRIGGDRIAWQVLADGDQFQIGETHVTFHVASLLGRPADPDEAIFRTMMEDERADLHATHVHFYADLPEPKPVQSATGALHPMPKAHPIQRPQPAPRVAQLR